MRKVNPADVRAGFRDDTDELMEYMHRARRVLEGESNEKADVSRLASMVFLDLYVGFERFLSDLFLAYLNRDFSRYQSDLENRIMQSTESKFKGWAKSRVKFNPISHINVDDLEEAVDPVGWNLTFKDTDAILDRADAWLVTAHRNRVKSISAQDKRLVDTARSIRDFIAHQSRGSKSRMNANLASVSDGGGNANLARGANEVHNVGSYLKAVFNGHRRIAIYADRLKTVAAKM